MPKPPDQFAQHILDQLRPLGDVTLRSMFGATCLFLDGTAFGIVDSGLLYLKVDDVTKPKFAAAGGRPFTYHHKSKNVAVEMSYMTVPLNDIDTRKALLKWGALAADVARKKKAAAATTKSKAKKSKSKPKSKAKK